jgi:hypothetical protein
MSAHRGAPGFGHAQMATPSYTASTQGPSTGARRGGRPVRRKALFVAAATLCAPALAALALAALAATGGGDRAALGSLAGAQGLRGTTTPSVHTTPAAKPGQDVQPLKRANADSPASGPAQRHPASNAAPTSPVHRPAPSPPAKVSPAPRPQAVSPSVPSYDPSQPGAPTSSGTVSPSDGSSGSSTGSTTDATSSHHGSGSPSPTDADAYTGGG